MKAVRMTTLECQRKNLEREIIQTKEMMWDVKESEYPDIGLLNQLRDKVERNLQLINMIDHHLDAGQQYSAQRH